MRIYLDSCVFQDLKNDNNLEILTLILNSKSTNIYCYSEAHIYDLARDRTEQKFSDMIFIEQIVENNCFSYKKGITHGYYTPQEYYNLFDWNDITTPLSKQGLFDDQIYSFLKLIPLDLNSIMPKDLDLGTIPSEFRDILTSSTSFYDFMMAMLSFSENLSYEQKKFKSFLTYLHGNTFLENFYKHIGIEGFDGNEITDAKQLRESLIDYNIRLSNNNEEEYDFFQKMYNSLEFLGLVKGKPKKQKINNMIDDGRHAFFGAYCDIVVSKDDDFIRKSKFLYLILGLNVPVFNLSEFHDFLITNTQHKDNLISLMDSSFVESDNYEFVTNTERGEQIYRSLLPTIHLACFDVLYTITHEHYTYFYYTKDLKNYSKGTLIKEIEYVVTNINKDLKNDINKKGIFSSNEIDDDKWEGRQWRLNKSIVSLELNRKLYLWLLTPSFLDYLENNSSHLTNN